MNEPYGQGFEPENNTFYANQGPDGVFSTNARYETLAEYTAIMGLAPEYTIWLATCSTYRTVWALGT